MEYRDPHKQNGTITTRVVCAVCFLLFAFFWLYFFQADALAVAQHLLSDGVTHYDRTVGAFVIILALYLVHLAVYVLSRLKLSGHALTYLPSMALLAFFSNFSVDEAGQIHFGMMSWLTPVILILCVWGIIVARQAAPLDKENKASFNVFSRTNWINVLVMVVMMLLVVAVGNTNAVFHYQAHAEVALLDDDNAEALRVGERSLETNQSLTVLRAFALSRQGQLGERLFHYAIDKEHHDILPLNQSDTPLLIFPVDSIWSHVGGRPVTPSLDVYKFLAALENDTLATDAVGDYKLCSYLLDERLEDFAKTLPCYYGESDSLPLPRHYQEALIIYHHQLGDSTLICKDDSLLRLEWDDYLRIISSYPERAERRIRIQEHFPRSYFLYYQMDK